MFKQTVKAGCVVVICGVVAAAVVFWPRWDGTLPAAPVLAASYADENVGQGGNLDAGRDAPTVPTDDGAVAVAELVAENVVVAPQELAVRHWDPCLTVSWSYSQSAGAFSDSATVAVLQAATSEIAALTGLEFRQVGSQESALIDWSWSAQEPSERGELAKTFFTYKLSDNSMLSAHVDLYSSQLDKWATGTSSLKAVVLHELGHAIGLEHSTDATSMMTAKLRADRTATLDARDRARFASAGGTCQRSAR